MLPQNNRLQKEKDIERVYKKGKGFKEDFLILKTVKNDLTQSRFGFIVSQKVSKKAAVRNKVKRRLREIIKKYIEVIEPGFDILIITRSGAAEKSFLEIEKTLTKLFKRAKLIK
jgi:ribonuclease P protein component